MTTTTTMIPWHGDCHSQGEIHPHSPPEQRHGLMLRGLLNESNGSHDILYQTCDALGTLSLDDADREMAIMTKWKTNK